MSSESLRPLRPVVKRSAPAKINLTLRVGALKPSGFHDLDTLFQAIELSDRVSVALVGDPGASAGTSIPRIDLETRGHDVGPVAQNLVYRAAEAYLAALPEGTRAGLQAGLALRIELEKNIPAGTGLGGGSSDAAATLLALDELLGTESSQERLMRIGASLGSDVPFFLCGSALARGEGRGEVLTPLTPLPALPVIVALPGVHVSTPEAYRMLDREREAREKGETGEVTATRAGTTPGAGGSSFDWPTVARAAINDFEGVVFRAHPAIARAHAALAATSPLFVRMSGSGAAVFAVYEEQSQAESAIQRLEDSPTASCRFVLTRTLVSPPIR